MGQLDVRYFRTDVVEQYRNDPRFTFENYDFGLHISISDERYLHDAENPADKTGIWHLGFGFRGTRDEHERVCCTCLRDLAQLTPTHQQRWKTYEVEEGKLWPHPMWWNSQMGEFPDGVGPFERLMLELQSWNDLHLRAFGTPLLKTTERPRELGWILRPSTRELEDFVHLLDKLLSENIQSKALDAAGMAKVDAKGNHLGTLKRIEDHVERIQNPQIAEFALRPLKKIRKMRQAPAHVATENRHDDDVPKQQADLLEEVVMSLELLRRIWHKHRANRDWKPDDILEHGVRYAM